MNAPPVQLALVEFGNAVQWRDWLQLAQAAAGLRAAGQEAEVRVLKGPRQRSAALADWKRSKPGLVFVSVPKEQLGAALGLFDEAARSAPELASALVVGGTLGTLCTQEFSNHSMAQGILLGDYYEGLLGLAAWHLSGEAQEDVPGLWWRGARGWVLSPATPRLVPFADLPEPRLSDLRPRHVLKVTGSAPLQASRGFPFRSLFSAEPLLRPLHDTGDFYQTLPVDRVIQRALFLKEALRPPAIDFVDELFPWQTRWVEEFAGRWAEEVGLPFRIDSAAEHLTEANVRLLAGAGLRRARFCLESGNDKFRARFSTVNVGNPAVREAVELLAKANVQTHAHFLLGAPNESASTLEDTVKFADSLPVASVGYEVFRPWPQVSAWRDTEPAPTIATQFICASPYDQQDLLRPLQGARRGLAAIDARQRAAQHQRDHDAALDALSDFAYGAVRSPHEHAVEVRGFGGLNPGSPVIALRVPSQISWETTLGARSLVRFGIALEPCLPGLRHRPGVSFSIKIQQDGETYRLFQKVLLQALDPDSRHWHWFTLPTRPAKVGRATVILESTLYGRPDEALPEDGDIWAGWAGVAVGEHLAAPPLMPGAIHFAAEDES
ncbi:MAG: hypothetical protein SF028_01690 [Candidatus Sumerlaeia bacterium]|nr:hypothetical protein [Candidatus Sumerlaeia bacterium]